MILMSVVYSKLKTETLKQFLLKMEVKKLYRNIIRVAKKHPVEAEREGMCQYARSEFERNKHLTDERDIRAHIVNGMKQLRHLQMIAGFTRQL